MHSTSEELCAERNCANGGLFDQVVDLGAADDTPARRGAIASRTNSTYVAGMRTRFIIAAMFVLGACSGGPNEVSTAETRPEAAVEESVSSGAETVDVATEDDAGSETTMPPEPSSAAPVITLPRPTESLVLDDNDDNEVVEDDVAAIGPVTFDEVVDFGIEADIWDERDGLTNVLGWVLGKVASDQVPGIEEVVFPDLGEVLRRANAVALGSEYDDEELASLRAYYEVFAPSADALDLSASASRADLVRPQGFAGGAVQGAAGDCAPIDPDEWDEEVAFASCYDVLTDEVAGVQLRVFVPRSFSDDPVALNLGPVALSALGTSVLAYQDLGTIGDMDLILTDVQMSEVHAVAGVATSTAHWGTLTVAGCPISIFGNAWAEGPEAFEQVVAHEAWHCVQHYDGFPMSVPSGTAWYREGGAEFFSNVAFPSNDFESRAIGTFDRRSLRKPLHALSYDAWMWWQYLSNLNGENYVADLQRTMMQSGGNGVDQLAGLDEVFHNFIVEFTAGTLKDQDGTDLPRAHRYLVGGPDVTKNDAGRKVETEVKQYVGVRFQLAYAQELRVFQTDATATGGRFSSAERSKRTILAEWRGLAPEVRSTCNGRSRYVFVGTSFIADQTFTVQVDRVEEAACDPCVLGTWSLRLDTFKSMLENGMAAQGGALPGGIEWSFSGAYYIQFVDQEAVREQRDGLVINLAMANVGAFSFTIDSFAAGTYSADGERVVVTNLAESFNRVSTNLPGGGSLSFPSAIDQGAGTYECDTETLTIAVDGFDSIVWDRVDRILEPPAGDVTVIDG